MKRYSSTTGGFTAGDHAVMSGDILSLPVGARGAPSLWCVESRGAAEHPASRRAAPRETRTSPRGPWTAVEKPRCPA